MNLFKPASLTDILIDISPYIYVLLSSTGLYLRIKFLVFISTSIPRNSIIYNARLICHGYSLANP